MTRWQDISDEDKREFAWVEVTDRGDEWPTYIKGARRQAGKPARLWEYRQFYFCHDVDLEHPQPYAPWAFREDGAVVREQWLDHLGGEGWELVSAAIVWGEWGDTTRLSTPKRTYAGGSKGLIEGELWIFKREAAERALATIGKGR